MAKDKKKGKGSRKKGEPLSGVEAMAKKHPMVMTLAEGGLVLLAAIAAGGAGAALGKHSLIAGIPVTLLGLHKKNKYIIAAGLGLAIGSGKSAIQNTDTSTQGVEGFDFKTIAGQAKDRVGTFLKNFSEKLYIAPKKEDEQTAGLAGEEQVTYFMNPYGKSKEIDMSALDRVQEQIAQMSKGTSGLNDAELEREF